MTYNIKPNPVKDGIFSGVIIILGSLFLFIEGIAELFNQNTPIMIGYFTPAMDTFSRMVFGLIIIGIVNFIVMTILSKNFKIKNLDNEVIKFKQDESYILKVGSLIIQRHNREIRINQTKKINLFSIFKFIFFIVFTFFTVEPMNQVILVNLNLNDPIYSDPIGQYIMLYVLFCYLFIFMLLWFVCKYIIKLVHIFVITLDPDSNQITFQNTFVFPVNIFLKGQPKLILPLENLDSLKVYPESVEFLRGTKVLYKDVLFLTISSSNWSGNEDLLKKLTSKAETDRVKVIDSFNNDTDFLNSIKNLLEEFTPLIS